jgi:hypothetical protein
LPFSRTTTETPCPILATCFCRKGGIITKPETNSGNLSRPRSVKLYSGPTLYP